MAYKSDPERAQTILNYEFKNLDLLREALQAPWLDAIVGGKSVPQGNKRLALVGQSVLETAIHQRSYMLGFSREQASMDKEAGVNPKRLAKLTQQVSLDACIARNPSQGSQAISPGLLSDTMKAILGAVWIDCGVNMAKWTAVADMLGALG